MKAEEIWQAALGELQLQMTRATFATWVKDTSVISYEDGTFIIGVHSDFAKDWLENRLLNTIKRTLIRIVGHAVEVKFVLKSPPRPEQRSSGLKEEEMLYPLSSCSANNSGKSSHMLNPRYTFESFIVGSSNRLAQAASLAVAERPAEAYNPLFIYGGVGLGKTHLLHASGHVSQRRGWRVLYVSSERFTNDLINSIRTHTMGDFREKYRAVDVLLIDDIHFIAGKNSTQEEFFHTFNTLHAANKQIIISSDRPPRAIPTLEERLRSRFEWGLIADIQPPDLEMRLAILRFKAEKQPTPVSDEVINFIARRIQNNIRELEGALNRVIAYARVMHCPLDVETCAKALQDFLNPSHPLTPEDILKTVAAYYGLEIADLTGPRRSRKVVGPRQMAMYLLREETKASLPQIGEMLGGRDYTTVLYGYEKVATRIEADDSLRREMLAIKEILYDKKR